VVVLTWPLSTHLATAVPHDVGDPVMSVAALWWNAHVMPLTARWWDGFAFYPARGTVAFSDHRLGASLIATPLQWAGASAVTAYNLTLLATFPLCALAAYWLGFTLTGRTDAAFLCGLAYGFNPYRVAHLEHLELLAAFGMPAALAALHQLLRTRRLIWALPFAAALFVQGLCTSYYALFFLVLLALWMSWFLRREDYGVAIAIAIAAACALAAMSPIVMGYSRIHDIYGFARRYTEIRELSADVTSIVTASPLVGLWGWTSALNTPERQLFPGLTIVALAVCGLIGSLRRHLDAPDRRRGTRIGLTVMAAAAAIVAATAVWIGPWRAGPISVRDAFKPFSVAVALAALAVVCHPRFTEAYRRRSDFALYVIATIVLFACSLGPTPTFLGSQIMYRPPYWWLMDLPVFSGGVRAPARFAMVAWLALSAAATIAYARLWPAPSRRRGAIVALSVAIVADGWIRALPLPAVPDPWPRMDGDVKAVMQLPAGDPYNDAAAMYRATQQATRSVNGLSGYDPQHYIVLRLALADRDPTAIEALAEYGPLAIVVEEREDRDGAIERFLASVPGVTTTGVVDRWTMFRVERRTPPATPLDGHDVPPVAARSDSGPVDIAKLTDGSPDTFWLDPQPQFAGETLVVDIGKAVPLISATMSLAHGDLYPRRLSVATSADGVGWTEASSGPMGGETFRAVLRNPQDAHVELPLRSAIARFVRFKIEQDDAKYPWVVTDVSVKRE
jgi:hypothetical protein